MQLENNIDEFDNKKEERSAYCLGNIKGTKGLRGLPMLEESHSSALCFLEDRGREEIKYYKDPSTLVKDLLKKKFKLYTKFSKALYDYCTCVIP